MAPHAPPRWTHRAAPCSAPVGRPARCRAGAPRARSATRRAPWKGWGQYVVLGGRGRRGAAAACASVRAARVLRRMRTSAAARGWCRTHIGQPAPRLGLELCDGGDARRRAGAEQVALGDGLVAHEDALDLGLGARRLRGAPRRRVAPRSPPRRGERALRTHCRAKRNGPGPAATLSRGSALAPTPRGTCAARRRGSQAWHPAPDHA